MRNEFRPDVTLYIVDDERAVRESMVGLFGTGMGYRVQAFSSGEEFLAKVQPTRADCVLLDLRMDGGMSGLEVHDTLVAQGSPMVVVFLSGHGDIPTAMDARSKGAFNWLVKGMDTDELQTKVGAAMAEAEARCRHQHQRDEVMQRWAALSPRKQEAARHVRKGWPNKLVADEMGIGVRVAEKYRFDVFETLWVKNPTELDRLMRDFHIE